MAAQRQQLETRSASVNETGAQSRLLDALEDYYAIRDNDGDFDRQRFLDKYSDVAEDLNELLNGFELLNEVAPQAGDFEDSKGASRIRPLQNLGDFRLVREIGRGGMGVVYEATQLTLGRRVALKVLPFAAVLDERQIQRFTNEAQAAALIEHSHIVPVYSVGIERGVHYYAMKFIDGRTLADVIGELGKPADGASSIESTSNSQDTEPIAQLSTSRTSDRVEFYRAVARMGIEAAEALHCAHEHGVVHRDIKPSNLLIDRRGKLWITDFGLAQIQTDQNLTMSGDLLGTLRYMSPEQVAGGKVLDQRTDVYSLGLTLYELLSGRPAFAGDDRQHIMRRILDDVLPPARTIDRLVPRDLDTILLKATAKEPTDRYATAEELATDLRLFREDRPIAARLPGRVERVRRWGKRNPVLATLLTTIILLLTLLSAGSTFVAWRAIQLAHKPPRVWAVHFG